MTQAQHLLRRDKPVGDYSDETGHNQRNETLNCVEPKDISSKSY